jgi:hypothetical protein
MVIGAKKNNNTFRPLKSRGSRLLAGPTGPSKIATPTPATGKLRARCSATEFKNKCFILLSYALAVQR